MLRVATVEPELTAVSGSLVWPQDGWPGGPGPSTDSLVPLPSPGAEPNLAVRPSLESLLAASSHMLKEVLDSPFSDPLKNLRLPRELSSNKKYSWMQKKEERVRPDDLHFSCGPSGRGWWAGVLLAILHRVAHSGPFPLSWPPYSRTVSGMSLGLTVMRWDGSRLAVRPMPFVACVVLGSCRPPQVPNTLVLTKP